MKEIKNIFDEISKNEVKLKLQQNIAQREYTINILNKIFKTKRKSFWQIPNCKDDNKIIFKNDFKKSKWGLIDLKAKEVSELIYNVCYVINDIVIVEDTDIYINNNEDMNIDIDDKEYTCESYGILNLKDQKIIMLNNENNIKQGLIILDEKIDFKYLNYKYCQKENLIIMQNKAINKYSFINIGTKEIIECEYDNCDDFFEGFAIVEKNNKFGFIDTNGKEVIPCIYNSCWDFSESLAVIMKNNNKCGYINTEGKEVIPCVYDYCSNFKNGFAFVLKNDNISFINTDGKEICKFKYSNCYNFKNGFAPVEKDNKWGFINTEGEEIIPCIYDCHSFFEANLFKVRKNNKWGFINKENKEVIPLIYNECFDFSEGLAAVNKDNKWGYVNKNGEEIIPLKYDFCYDFKNGFAVVVKDNKFGFINKNGKEITSCIYDYCNNPRHGFATIEKDNKVGFIDKSFKEYWFNKSNCFKNIYSSFDTLYYLIYKDTFIIKTFVFLGTLKEFEKNIKEAYKNTIYAKQYFEIINFLKENK